MIEYTDENLNKAYVDADRIVQLIPGDRPQYVWIVLEDGRMIESYTSIETLRDRINQQKQASLKVIDTRIQATINASQQELAASILRALEKVKGLGA